MKNGFLAVTLLSVALLVVPTAVQGQAPRGVGIGTTAPDPHAALEIAASDKGLLIPRLDSVQRVAIASPPQGLIVYQKDGRQGLWYHQVPGGWQHLSSGGGAPDNLGSHTATRNLDLGTHQLVGNGGTSGLSIGADGHVRAAGLAGTGSRLVQADASGTLQ
ncbi:MAG TPA: hypothetical protein VEI97_12250, partial [bacterium]|nr:hypothetical protein [bacterium]